MINANRTVEPKGQAMRSLHFNGLREYATPALLSLALLGAGIQGAAAQTASDLTCNACVQASDLAANAVKTSELSNAAVNTEKLANNAVTVAKIANNAVSAAKIAAGAVSSAKIGPNAVNRFKIPDGAVTAAKLAPGAVNSAKIADDAVTTAKLLSGAVTAAKLADEALIARTLFVRPVGDGADAAANGQALLDALTEVGAASPAPGVDNPWLIKIEPGVYNVGTTAVIMLPYVDIEGSGQGVTHIEGAVPSPSSTALLNLASNSELRHLTVSNAGSEGLHHGVGIGQGLNATENWRISHVTASGSGGTNFSAGLFFFPTSCDGGVITDVTAVGSGPGGNRGVAINCTAGTVTATNVSGSSSGGTASIGLLKNNGSVLRVRDSAFSGGTNSLDVNDGTLVVISSEVDGTVANGATLRCVGAYDAAGDPLDGGCM